MNQDVIRSNNCIELLVIAKFLHEVMRAYAIAVVASNTLQLA